MKGFPLRLFVFCLGAFVLGAPILAAQTRARAQVPPQVQRDSLRWEQILQRYQVFCDGAVAAKAGDKEAARQLRTQADSISLLLKAVKGSNMTPSQQQRFSRMKQRYADVVSLPEFPAVPAPSVIQVVSGQTIVIRDTVFVVREIHQTDTVRIVEQVEKLVEVPVDRVVEVPVPAAAAEAVPLVSTVVPQPRYLLLAQAVVPDFSYGLMAGVIRKAGFYVRFDSNFHFPKTDYACTSDGQASYGQIWTTGRSVCSRLSTTGGALWHPLSWLSLYAGAGYGRRTLCWEDVSGHWAQVSDASYSGVAADLGVVFNLDHFALSVGVTSLGLSRIDASLGVGVVF